ncbi:putative short chain type dehydrogenase [Saccharata proteae CBS 121410]|uniref:Putative short chain type dehydrogenase n=1 Tax=Saccharata proteae CBS 121410 TaxID=1314787 RepID=A0A6A5YEA1_9PEZI|nr:putative short chain type dehydrogenase [Saccharata proteae CBS 121410]
MSNRLPSKIAIVTGASSGIGRAIALAFHREGAFLVCADLKPDVATETPAAPSIPTHEVIQKENGNAIFVKVDVTKGEQVEALVRRAVEEWGRVDIFINNAGLAPRPTPIWTTSESSWDLIFAVNARGVFLGTKHASAQMILQTPGRTGDRGWIVNVASVLGLVGEREVPAYVASKHAVVGLTKSAALDCAPHRVHVNAICPGYVRTPMIAALLEAPDAAEVVGVQHPFRGLGRPDEIARVAVFLASEENTWMTGASVSVDGGYSCR